VGARALGGALAAGVYRCYLGDARWHHHFGQRRPRGAAWLSAPGPGRYARERARRSGVRLGDQRRGRATHGRSRLHRGASVPHRGWAVVAGAGVDGGAPRRVWGGRPPRRVRRRHERTTRATVGAHRGPGRAGAPAELHRRAARDPGRRDCVLRRGRDPDRPQSGHARPGRARRRSVGRDACAGGAAAGHPRCRRRTPRCCRFPPRERAGRARFRRPGGADRAARRAAPPARRALRPHPVTQRHPARRGGRDERRHGEAGRHPAAGRGAQPAGRGAAAGTAGQLHPGRADRAVDLLGGDLPDLGATPERRPSGASRKADPP
jgi:hypothetical protein